MKVTVVGAILVLAMVLIVLVLIQALSDRAQSRSEE